MSLLRGLHHAGALRAVDVALADTLRRLDPDTGDEVLAAAALAARAIDLGHAAFDPARPDAVLPSLDSAIAARLPGATAWLEALRASRWVDQPRNGFPSDASAPLVLEHGLLYLRRYREYEQRLADRLRALANTPAGPVDIAALQPLFAILFPDALQGDRQARAAAVALLRHLLLVTGGPGTGKTTTIARVLLLLVAKARHLGLVMPRIALAAPTGRAAERLAASLRTAIVAIRALPGVDAVLCDALPQDARTLHRLLGAVPDSPRFRHDARAPLPYDIVVVDEASMVDLPLMAKLVDAVPVGARLLLLGDRDQLPSVDAGDVLSAIGAAAGEDETLPADVAMTLAPLLGVSPTVGKAESNAGIKQTGVLHGHRVHLRRGYRQSSRLDLGPLAEAARAGDADGAMQLLRGHGMAGVHFHEDMTDPLVGQTREQLLAHWRAIADAASPTDALALANRVRVLTALRDGQQGAGPLNARIEELLAGTQREPYFHGRLVLVTRNSYRHGLFNGDIGVCLRDASVGGPVVAWFAGDGESVRGFHPAALPAHTGAFAMTVHKAQGSEFDAVWLLLPREDVRSLSRELVYTAMTRARSELHLCAREGVLRAALARHAVRVSGLSHRFAASQLQPYGEFPD